MISKACHLCGKFHIYNQACDPQAQREFLRRSFAENAEGADARETTNIARYLLGRKNP